MISLASRVSGKGSGSAAPGLFAERMRPQMLQEGLSSISGGLVLVTGTNGKTTTTKMLVELLEAEGMNVLTNKSGSNFTRGILSMIVKHASLSGKLHHDIAVLEMDEAYAKLIAEKVPPKIVVALNVHRDQLDRYGELDATAKMIGDAMKHARFAVVNADDPLLVKVARDISEGGPTLGYFGASEELISQLPTDDELHSSEMQMSKFDAMRPPVLVELVAHAKESIGLKVDGEITQVKFNLDGIYNAVNAAAAVMTAMEIMPRVGGRTFVNRLATLQPAFGRGEHFDFDGKRVKFALVKNPAGFNHNLSTMLDDAQSVLISINDLYADGRDVSWLWDVHFDQYKDVLNSKKVYVTGVRAYDMAVRLQQEDIETTVVENNYSSTFDKSLDSLSTGESVVVMATYTAMLELREEVSKHVEVPPIW